MSLLPLGVRIGLSPLSGLALRNSIESLDTELNRSDPNSFQIVVQFTNVLVTTGNLVKLSIDSMRAYQVNLLKPVKIQLEAAIETAETVEDALEAAGEIPNRAMTNIADVLEQGTEKYQRASDLFLQKLQFIDQKMDESNKIGASFYSALEIIEKVGYVMIPVNAAITAADTFLLRDQRAVDIIEDTIGTAFTNANSLFVAENYGPPTSYGPYGAGLSASNIAQQTDIEVSQEFSDAFNGFDARIAERTQEIEQVQALMADIVANIQGALNGLTPDEYADYMAAKIATVQDLLENLDAVDDIADFTGILAAFSDAADLFEEVADAIEEATDILGPVTDVIDEVIETLEDAIGLTALLNEIRDTIEDELNALITPITEELQELINEIQFDGLDEIAALMVNLKSFIDLVQDIIRDPIALTDDLEAAADGLLDGSALLVSTDGNDTIRLELDPEHDADGLGGMALADGGNNHITGTDRSDVILSGAGQDTIFGLAGNDFISSGDGDNTVSGGDGDDQIDAKSGADTLRGDDGNDLILGGDGDDTLFGGADDDQLQGGAGYDYLEDGTGNDTLLGGDQDDVLVATAGTNILDGQGGFDTIRTAGSSSATHWIYDPTAVLIGGAGSDNVVLADAYAVNSAFFADPSFTNGSIYYDTGSGHDRLEVTSLDLNAFAGRFESVETLGVSAAGGTASTLRTNVSHLLQVDTLELSGDGAIVIEVTDGVFDLDGMSSGGTPLRVDFAGMTQVLHMQDGSNAATSNWPPNLTVDLTLKLLDTVNGELRGVEATTVGMTFEGSAGSDVIVGGGGSDVIRPGIGSDTVNGGGGDSGNRFDLDSAVGDVIEGSLADLDGDFIENLTNRVDRVRVTGPDAATVANYTVATTPGTGQTVLTVSDGISTSIITLVGDYPKLQWDVGSYIDTVTQSTVHFLEFYNNNVPPTAVDDDYVTRNSGGGDNGWIGAEPFDPLGNDFDVDTPASPGVERRSIAETESLAALLGLVDTVGNAAGATASFRNGLIPDLTGTPQTFTTALGNSLIWDGDELYYEAKSGLFGINLRRLAAGDPVPPQFIGDYDPTVDFPFFGRDRLFYAVFDNEGEISNTASVDILIRPDEVTLDSDGDLGLPSVRVFGETSADNTIAQLFYRLSGTAGHDYIHANAGVYRGYDGNDVLDGRASTGPLQLFGGQHADWVEGGQFDDFISGGGITDYALGVATASPVNLPTSISWGDTAEIFDGGGAPNILLGGAGDNVFEASGRFSYGWPGIANRDTIFVLDGGAETIVGPIYQQSGTTWFDPDGFGSVPLTAAALRGDTIIGFDDDDQIVVALSKDFVLDDRVTVSDTYLSSVQSDLFPADKYDLEITANVDVPRSTSFILTSNVDAVEANLGRDPSFLFQQFPDISWGPTNEHVFFSASDTIELNGSESITVNGSVSTNSAPQILTYEIHTNQVVPGPGTTGTRVFIDLNSYKFDYEFLIDYSRLDISDEYFIPDYSTFPPSIVWSADVDWTGRGWLRKFLVEDENFIDSTDKSPGPGVLFELELDGFYHADRFSLGLTGMRLDQGVPLDTYEWNIRFPDVSALDSANVKPGEFYSAAGPANINYFAANTLDALGLRLTYDSSAPVGQVDAATVRRGEAVIFDVMANDTDADGDAILIRDLVFASAADEADYLDGDTGNGEIILQTNLNTGFGDGVITFIAPDAFMGDVTFSYIGRDGEFETGPIDVTVTVTGLPPVLGDDLIILPDGSPGIIPLLDLIANDFDPDIGEAPDLGSISFSTLNGAQVTANELQLTQAQLDLLAAKPASLDAPGNSVTFGYTLTDVSGAGASDQGLVDIRMAAPLSLSGPLAGANVGITALSVSEDEALSIDILSGRSGGFGDAEIQPIAGGPVDVATGEIVGTVDISGNDVIFTPFADLSGITAAFTVVVADQVGQTASIDLQIDVLPVDDAPVLLLMPPFETVIITDEDLPVSGEVLLFDPDAVDVATLGVAGAVALLDAVQNDPSAIDPVSLAAIAPALPAPAPEVLNPPDIDPVDGSPRPATNITSQGGSFDLGSTASVAPLSASLSPISDFTYWYDYKPAPNTNGADWVDIAFADGQDSAFAMMIASVNDAPVFLSAVQTAPVLFDIGIETTFDLLGDIFDPDSVIDPSSLQFDIAPDPALVAANLSGGILSLTGVGSGSGGFTYSVADEEGLRSAPQTIAFEVNSPPSAIDDRFVLASPYDPLVIDAIGNDSDADGTVSYVLGASGIPEAIDPRATQVSLGAAPSTGLKGDVSWSDVQGAFIYTAPTDPALLGGIDHFFYDIIDDDGSTSRGLVSVELIAPPGSGDTSVRLGSSFDDKVSANVGTELFVLGDGINTVSGDFAELDADTIADFKPGDVIEFLGVPVGPVTVTAVRERGPLPPAPVISALSPSVAEIFGSTPIDELTHAFIGNTELTISADGQSSVIHLLGAYLGQFTAITTTAGIEVTYTPSLSGAGPLIGGALDDDIRGNGLLEGHDGDDVLQGGVGPDILDGGPGRDVLIGHGDSDTLIGGPDADLFLLTDSSAIDTILDFSPLHGDRIGLTESVFLDDDFSTLLAGLDVTQDVNGFTLFGDLIAELSLIDLVDSSDTGESPTDDVTGDTTPTIAFTAEAGALVEIDWDDGNGFVAASSNGTGALQQETLGTAYGADGLKIIEVRVTDLAGNDTTESLFVTIDTLSGLALSNSGPGVASASTSAGPITVPIVHFTIDPVAELTPIDLVDGSDTGGASTDDITSDVTPTIAFIAEAGADVEINWGDGSGFVAASNNGTGALQQETFAAGYTNGQKVIQVRVTDAAANVATEALSVTIDTSISLSPIDLTDASDDGIASDDNITGDTNPTIEFTAEAGALVEIDWADGNGYVAAASSGTGATQQESLGTAYTTNGVRTIEVRVEDAAGNATSQTLDVTLTGIGDERFIGTSGSDLFFGNAGNDQFLLRYGSDAATGGQDADQFIIDGRYVNDGDAHTVTDLNFGEGDKLLFRLFDTGTFDNFVNPSNPMAVSNAGASATFDSLEDIVEAHLNGVLQASDSGDGDALLTIANGSDEVTVELDGIPLGSLSIPAAIADISPGDDTIAGGRSDDSLRGYSGYDTLLMRWGNDTANGGADADQFVIDGRYVNDGDAHTVMDLNFANGDFIEFRFMDAGTFDNSIDPANDLFVYSNGTKSRFDSIEDILEAHANGMMTAADDGFGGTILSVSVLGNAITVNLDGIDVI